MTKQPENQTLVALTPADMVPAQAELSAWCDRKVQALSDEADELELHQRLAIENGWKTSVVVASLNRTARRITYYTKIKAALAEGYLLVPNMPVDVLAVRVNREKPPQQVKHSRWDHFAAKPQSLPAGEGRYVDETLTHRDQSYTVAGEGGKQERKTLLISEDYDEVDFPVRAMKPTVLKAAARAMALRIFDQIGTVANEGRDPILIGQLFDPRGNRRRASFFIAWWVDTLAL
jgi:hypothetical protein